MAELHPRVRWDRVGRFSLLAVGLLLIYLYINPLVTLLQTLHEASAKRGQVAELQHQHRALVARERSLREPGTLELEARRLGMVRPNERAYVIQGLPHSGS